MNTALTGHIITVCLFCTQFYGARKEKSDASKADEISFPIGAQECRNWNSCSEMEAPGRKNQMRLKQMRFPSPWGRRSAGTGIGEKI